MDYGFKNSGVESGLVAIQDYYNDKTDKSWTNPFNTLHMYTLYSSPKYNQNNYIYISLNILEY